MNNSWLLIAISIFLAVGLIIIAALVSGPSQDTDSPVVVAPANVRDPAPELYGDKPLSPSDFNVVENHRLGVQVALPKEAVEYGLDSDTKTRVLPVQLFDDGKSEFVGIGIDATTTLWRWNDKLGGNESYPGTDIRLKLYVGKAKNLDELTAFVRRATGSTCIASEDKNPNDAFHKLSIVPEGKKETGGFPDFATECSTHGEYLFDWDKNLGKAYFMGIGNDGPVLSTLDRDGYFFHHIKLLP